MTEQHTITPPQELIDLWFERCPYVAAPRVAQYIATIAAQWGADRELDACVEWFPCFSRDRKELRAHRRPKLPSLKEEALEILDRQPDSPFVVYRPSELDIIRRALKSISEEDN